MPNAECKVYDSLPLRTMTCTCLEGFTGKGDQRCEPISKSGNKYIIKGENLVLHFLFFLSKLLLLKWDVPLMMSAHLQWLAFQEVA